VGWCEVTPVQFQRDENIGQRTEFSCGPFLSLCGV
jgi:predicted double-glycine peptidase